MDEDKKINTGDLPHEWRRTTTQQPEEYIDKSNLKKDETDTPRPPADSAEELRRGKGDQETA